jgi:hypothetical protein
MTIDMLPDDVLLDIFDFSTWENRMWQKLLRVCQKWRRIVFSAPGRLKLELICTDGRPVRNTLHVWPPLPIRMLYFGTLSITIGDLRNPFRLGDDADLDDIISALEHKDRVCGMTLIHLQDSDMEAVLAAMQEPFPALIRSSFTQHICSIGLSEGPPKSPIPSWVDLYHVCEFYAWIASYFHFWVYRSFFCLHLALTLFTLKVFPNPSTFNRTRSSLASPR